LVQGLAGEDSFETPNFEVQTISADHAVPGRCFKIRDKRNDILMGFGGDGAYQAGLADFFAGCDVLVHEFSFGLNTPSPNVQRHSSIQDAARCAEEAGVRMLCPVHGPKNLSEQIEACGRKAAGIYHGVLHWPRAGELLCLSK
jgi:ribonuclease BN (tRNA processing enzyme)